MTNKVAVGGHFTSGDPSYKDQDSDPTTENFTVTWVPPTLTTSIINDFTGAPLPGNPQTADAGIVVERYTGKLPRNLATSI